MLKKKVPVTYGYVKRGFQQYAVQTCAHLRWGRKAHDDGFGLKRMSVHQQSTELEVHGRTDEASAVCTHLYADKVGLSQGSAVSLHKGR